MIFRQIKVGTSVIPLFRLILIGKSISYIIFMIQGHVQCQKVNLKVKESEICFLSNTVKKLCNTSFSWDFDW